MIKRILHSWSFHIKSMNLTEDGSRFLELFWWGKTSVLYRRNTAIFRDNCRALVVVVVALLFYVHGKHLRSCRDGQLT